MLYPNFDELVALKDRKFDHLRSSKRSVKSFKTGNFLSPFRGQGLEFDSVREYVPGDDIRNIDWRVTARTGSAHLKLFKEERERHVCICVDMNSTMRFGTRNTFKSVQAARTAAFLSWRAYKHQDRISAFLYGDVPSGLQFFYPKKGSGFLYPFFKALSEPPQDIYDMPHAKGLQPAVQASQAGTIIYMISDFMEVDPLFWDQAKMARFSKKCDLVFISINDPADQSLSPLGTLYLSQNSQEKYLADLDNEVGRNAYANQWQNNRKTIEDMTSRLNIPVISLTTESDIYKDLMQEFARRKME